MKPLLRSLVLAAALAAAACTQLATVRLQPETVDVGPGLRPLAGIQANATTLNFLFLRIPGDVNLDRVVNRMLVVAAKTMGADKVTQLRFHVDPEDGIWGLWRILGWHSAEASGVAVQIVAPPTDAASDEGPEPATVLPPLGAPTVSPR